MDDTFILDFMLKVDVSKVTTFKTTFGLLLRPLGWQQRTLFGCSVQPVLVNLGIFKLKGHV